jgi:predicted dehydrogenase
MSKSMRKLKVGVIGCGNIAQIAHLPHLRDLDDEFHIDAICDLSRAHAERIALRFNVEHAFTDHRQLLERKLDAVLVLTPFAANSVLVKDAAAAGCHILVEKPLTFTPRRGQEMVEAAQTHGVKLMLAYMQRFNPGYEYACRQIQKLENIRLIRIHTVHSLTMKTIREVYRIFDRHVSPPQHLVAAEATKRLEEEALLGTRDDILVRAYDFLLALGCHLMTVLRGACGDPNGVVSTEIWNAGESILSILDYGPDTRCIFEMLNSTRKRTEFEMTVYAENETVHIEFPLSYLQNAPTNVTTTSEHGNRIEEKTVMESNESAFKRELKHFHQCIVNNTDPLTDGNEGKKDIELLLAIAKKAID